MKQKGFTLVELLAVIVILAVLALITTPMILGVIEKAKKGALEDSAYGLIDSAAIYYAEGILDANNTKTEFTFENGNQTSEKKLKFKGKVEKGSVKLFSDGKSAVCISEGNYSAVKNVNDKKVKVVTGRCTYNSETDEYETVGLCQDLQDEIDELKRKHQEELDRLKKEYEDALSKITSDNQAALDQLKKDYEDRIKTIIEAYEAQIAELNKQLNIFKTGGNATAAQILAGQTAFVKGTLLTGTMPNRGATNSTLNAGGSYTIPQGYHNGSGKVTVNTLASQTGGNATVAQILAGQTAWVNGNKIIGTMANRGTNNGSITTGKGSYTIPQGYHNGSGKVNVDASAIANALTTKGITTDPNASFDTMAKNILALKTLSSNPNVVFGGTTFTAPYDCVVVMSWAATQEANDDYEVTGHVTLSGVKSWPFTWGNNHDSHWHTTNTSGNATFEATKGRTYTLNYDPGSSHYLSYRFTSITWIY